jgi:hypothetical protein
MTPVRRDVAVLGASRGVLHACVGAPAMLDCVQTVHFGRRCFRSVAKPALAGLLALLLLLGTSLSIGHSLHNSASTGDGSNHDLCLLCSFAKGQFSTSDAVLLSPALPLTLLSLIFFTGILPCLAFDYRLSPGRAPPGY